MGLALATIVMGLRRHMALILVPAATILLIVGLLAEQTGALAAVVMPIGHLMLVLLLASLASRNGPELQGRRFTSVTLFSGVGMLVFLGAVFLYYAAYDISVGVPQRAIIIGAVAFIGVTVWVGTWGKSVERPRAPFHMGRTGGGPANAVSLNPDHYMGRAEGRGWGWAACQGDGLQHSPGIRHRRRLRDWRR